MLGFFSNIVLAFIGAGGMSFITSTVRTWQEGRKFKTECATRITIAGLETQNSDSARKAEFDRFVTEKKAELQKESSKPTGNKIVDILRGIIRPFMAIFVMLMYAWIGWWLRELNDNEYIRMYLENFFVLTGLVFGYYMVDRSLNKR